MRFVLTCLFILCLLPAVAQARVSEPTFEEKFTREVEKKPQEQFLTLTVENDSLGGGTDRNYTSGVRLSWFDTADVPWGAVRALQPILPMFPFNETTSVHYSVGQNLYAPRNLHLSPPDSLDRPYAAFIYGSMGLISISKNHLDYLEGTLGVVGPLALGKQTQKFVHNIINSDNPQSWDYQLENEPGVMLSWQRLWPEAHTAEIEDLHFRLSPYVGATAGNVYTYGSAGVMFQLVPEEYKWQGMPLRVRPAMPGSGYFSVPEGEFSWSLFAGAEGRAVARNIFLDGNTFRDSPSVDKRSFVTDLSAGAALTFGRTQVSYTLNWRSEEFHGQHRPDLFGAVSVGYRF